MEGHHPAAGTLISCQPSELREIQLFRNHPGYGILLQQDKSYGKTSMPQNPCNVLQLAVINLKVPPQGLVLTICETASGNHQPANVQKLKSLSW